MALHIEEYVLFTSPAPTVAGNPLKGEPPQGQVSESINFSALDITFASRQRLDKDGWNNIDDLALGLTNSRHSVYAARLTLWTVG